MKINLSDVEIKPIDNHPEGYYFNGQPFTGTVVWEFNNVAGSEFEVKDGLKHGSEKDFLADGTITHLTNFKHGIEDGTCKEFFASGKLKEEMYFEKGELIHSDVYDENGQIIERFDTNETSS